METLEIEKILRPYLVLIRVMLTWQYLMEKEVMPSTFMLKDHIFVEMLYKPVSGHS